ncbi:hypothetical protein HDU82_007129 [Entophlyctis luteolus]|nr:hypothetical protein HDU82_007129 [Entophlyctis luteolus]
MGNQHSVVTAHRRPRDYSRAYSDSVATHTAAVASLLDTAAVSYKGPSDSTPSRHTASTNSRRLFSSNSRSSCADINNPPRKTSAPSIADVPNADSQTPSIATESALMRRISMRTAKALSRVKSFTGLMAKETPPQYDPFPASLQSSQASSHASFTSAGFNGEAVKMRGNLFAYEPTASRACACDGEDFARLSWDAGDDSQAAAGTGEYHPVHSSAYCAFSLRMDTSSSGDGMRDAMFAILACAFGSNIMCHPVRHTLAGSPNVKVLDIGCGKESWMDSVSKEFPNAECLGVDIDYNALYRAMDLPEGVLFELTLPFGDNEFDYVHAIHLMKRLPKNKVAKVIGEIVRVTKPGGFVELIESDLIVHTLGSPSLLTKLFEYHPAAKKNLDVFSGTNLAFNVKTHASSTATNVSHQTVSIPLGWNGLLGRAHARERMAFCDTVAEPLQLPRAMGITREKYTEVVEECFSEAVVVESRPFMNYTCVCFQVGAGMDYFFG